VRAAATATIRGRRAPAAAGRGEGQHEHQRFLAHPRDCSAQLAVTPGLLAMGAGGGARAAPAAAVCNGGRGQRKGASRRRLAMEVQWHSAGTRKARRSWLGGGHGAQLAAAMAAALALASPEQRRGEREEWRGALVLLELRQC
jgi:hypothetical protein